MKNSIIFIFCLFLVGTTAYSATDIFRGEGDTLFVRDVKNIEQIIQYDSAGYRSTSINIELTAYKVVDTIFMDSAISNKFSNSSILDALFKSGDTSFLESEKHVWYKTSELFSVMYSKEIKPYLILDSGEKRITYGEIIIRDQKNTVWKTLTAFIFVIFFPVYLTRIIIFNNENITEKAIINTVSLNKFFEIAFPSLVFIGIISNVCAGSMRVFLDAGMTDSYIYDYSHAFWWSRFVVCFFVATLYFLYERGNLIKNSKKTEKSDSIPDDIAGAE